MKSKAINSFIKKTLKVLKTKNLTLTLNLLFPLLFNIISCTHNNDDTEQMAAVLEKNSKTFYHHDNLFANNTRVAFYDSLIKANGLNYELRYFQGIDQLRAGRTEEAIENFKALFHVHPDTLQKYGLKPIEVERTKDYLGLSYLRLGEQENCILNHTAASCIIPIAEAGFHQKAEGSKQAIAIFEELLENDPEDYSSRWLLNIAYMTLGRYPEEVPKQWLIPPSAFESEYALPQFTDRAADIGFDIKGLAGGLIVEDFDNDGFLDILVSEWGPTDRLHYLHNNGDGSFTDIAEQAGIVGLTGGLNLLQADYNNDGFLDILILRGAWLEHFGQQPNSLLRNNCDNTFTDVTISSGLYSLHPTQAATWNDFNNDGWLDLFIGNESAGRPDAFHFSELFINNQDGTFTDIAETAGVRVNRVGFRPSAHYIKGVTSGDYNNDGWQDLYVSTGVLNKQQDFLFKNNGLDKSGQLTFTDVTKEAGLGGNHSTFSTWFWDYNNDGWLDIFAASYFRSNTQGDIITDVAKEYLGMEHGAEKGFLYENQKDGSFKNVSTEVNLNKILYSMGANFGDLDNDGYLDMYLGTGNIGLNTVLPNKMYRNNEGKSFQDVTTAGGFGNIQKGHGVSFADLDNDGDQDVLISMGGAFEGDIYQNTFYENPHGALPNSNNWIKIRLQGKESNKFGIGSRLEIEIEENGKTRKIYKDVNSGGSFGSSPIMQHIGIGTAQKVKSLTINWNGSKTVQSIQNLDGNKTYLINEGNNQVEKVELKELEFYSKEHQHH